MFALERIRSRSPANSLGSVPTLEQKQGDFSQTFTSSGRPFVIYDPLTIIPNPAFDPARAVTLTNLQFVRTPFGGNRIPQGRLNAIALHVLNDIPAPNQTGDPVTHLNNWYKGDIRSELDYTNYITRVDHNINAAWKIFARWNYNFRNGGRINYDGWDSPARRATHLTRRNDGLALDSVGTLTPQTVLSLRLGFTASKRNRSLLRPTSLRWDSPATLPASYRYPISIPSSHSKTIFRRVIMRLRSCPATPFPDRAACFAPPAPTRSSSAWSIA
jgi:hypothetical protein